VAKVSTSAAQPERRRERLIRHEALLTQLGRRRQHTIPAAAMSAPALLRGCRAGNTSSPLDVLRSQVVLLLVVGAIEELRGLEALVPAVARHGLDPGQQPFQFRLRQRLEAAGDTEVLLEHVIESMPLTRLAIGWLRA